MYFGAIFEGCCVFLSCRGPSLSQFLSQRSSRDRRQLSALKACCFARIEIPWPWYNCQNSQSAQKCLRRVLKVIWGPSSRESQKSLSHRPNPVSHRGKVPKKGFRTVQETVLGVSPRRPENTFRTLVKHFWAFWLFWQLYQGRGIAMQGSSSCALSQPLTKQTAVPQSNMGIRQGHPKFGISPTPDRGPDSPFPGKEGVGAPKTPISLRPHTRQKRELSVKQCPFPCGSLKKKGVFDRKLFLPGREEMGVFGPRNPLVQEMGDSGSVWGRGNPKPNGKKTLCKLRAANLGG